MSPFVHGSTEVETTLAAERTGMDWCGGRVGDPGVARPVLLRSVRWTDIEREVVWRAEELTLVRSKAVASLGSVQAAPELLDIWWVSLRESLAALAVHLTGRIGMSQVHLDASPRSTAAGSKPRSSSGLQRTPIYIGGISRRPTAGCWTGRTGVLDLAGWTPRRCGGSLSACQHSPTECVKSSTMIWAAQP